MSKTLFKEYFSHAGFFVSTLCIFANKVIMVGVGQYATLTVKQIFDENGKSSADAERHLSWLNLLSNILSVFLCFSIGYLSDHIQIHKLITIINLCVLITYFMLNHDI